MSLRTGAGVSETSYFYTNVRSLMYSATNLKMGKKEERGLL